MKFDGRTSKEWLDSAFMWEKKAEQYGPDMESSRASCLETAKTCRLNAERARWHVARVGKGRSSKLFLYEDDCQIAQLKFEFGRLRIGRWFTRRSESRFEAFCDSISVPETLDLLLRSSQP